jgi:hypothetical protein
MPRLTVKFEKMADAANAVKALKDLGGVNSWLDAADGYSTEFASEYSIPGADSAPSLSGLVLRSGGYAPRMTKGPLLAADPMVSGMGDRDDAARNHSTRLVVSAPEDKLEAVRKILAELGGS